ncbi:hypothetical protein NJB1604_25660 [Mycobacterium marinum]|nr:hypothetical protein NJB1604_25660 [Mycobacterium marinum]
MQNAPSACQTEPFPYLLGTPSGSGPAGNGTIIGIDATPAGSGPGNGPEGPGTTPGDAAATGSGAGSTGATSGPPAMNGIAAPNNPAIGNMTPIMKLSSRTMQNPFSLCASCFRKFKTFSNGSCVSGSVDDLNDLIAGIKL